MFDVGTEPCNVHAASLHQLGVKVHVLALLQQLCLELLSAVARDAVSRVRDRVVPYDLTQTLHHLSANKHSCNFDKPTFSQILARFILVKYLFHSNTVI